MKYRVIVFAIGIAAILQGCTCSRQGQTQSAGMSQTGAGKSVNLFIWGEYTSKAVLTDFEQKTGIHVNETNFTSNEEMLAKLQAGATGYDLVVPSDYMVSIMIKLGLLEPLDRSKIPNAANVDPLLLGKEFDPTNTYGLPYSWSTTGIAVVKSKSPAAVISYKTMLTAAPFKNRVSLLDDMREVFAVALKMQGDSVNTTDETKLKKAAATLAAVKQHVKEFNSTPAQALAQGDLIAAHMFSNEALRAQQQNPDLDFILPEEGVTMAIDCMVVLKSSQKKDEAHALINFMLDATSNQKFVEDMITSPVVKGVPEKLPVKLRNNPLISDAAGSMKKTEALQDIGEVTAVYDRLWTEIKAR